jgi:hypothetical protein
MYSLLFLDKYFWEIVTGQENISFHSKVIPINYWKIPVPVLNPPVYNSYKIDHFDYSCNKFMNIWIFLWVYRYNFWMEWDIFMMSIP